jgi:hypothetical protein
MMNPDGSLLPGMMNFAMTPATNPMIDRPDDSHRSLPCERSVTPSRPSRYTGLRVTRPCAPMR